MKQKNKKSEQEIEHIKKCNKVISDLNYALRVGDIAAAEIEEDTGCKNYDGVCIDINTIDKESFDRICEKLKLTCKIKTIDKDKFYLIQPRTESIHSKRAANVMATCIVLNELGYDAYYYPNPQSDYRPPKN